MFILLHGRKKFATLRRVLIAISTILFLLCTIHVAASLRQLLEAFVYAPPDVPNYSTTYWLNFTLAPFIIKDTLWDTLLLIQYCVLIWRLHVVFLGDWRVVVFPIILAVSCAACAYANTALSGKPNVGFYHSVAPKIIEGAWVLDLLLNASVTGGIALRLWWMGRKTAALTGNRTNQYAYTIYLMIESGAIFMATNILVFVLYISNSPAALPMLDVASQIATLTPLLIIVQVGLTGRYRILRTDSPTTALMTHDGISFPVATEEQYSCQDVPASRTYDVA
ncbi:hypothetical protein OG21DRAFT_1504964 [Imleria badia]|nr:hypothetical protein OG21DRAFT_1504964 [Imleria badia]